MGEEHLQIDSATVFFAGHAGSFTAVKQCILIKLLILLKIRVEEVL